VFSPDFQEFLQALSDNGAEFVVVGGYAVIHYGHVRATGDLDLFVNATLENSGVFWQH
jgi:predicted nucleotidyltransferase